MQEVVGSVGGSGESVKWWCRWGCEEVMKMYRR